MPRHEQDWYALLEVSPEASPEVIHHAYRALVKQHHPDQFHGSAQAPHSRMADINQAYTILSDATQRARYDRRRRRQVQAEANPRHTPMDKLNALMAKVPWYVWLSLWLLIFPRVLRIMMVTTVGQILLGMGTIFVFWRLMPKRPAS